MWGKQREHLQHLAETGLLIGVGTRAKDWEEATVKGPGPERGLMKSQKQRENA